MELQPGAKLGPYEILSRIGAGGMGQVWKARDTRLNRIVAIKTSSARFSDRFEREARAVAALNHPHICTLYDVGDDYLVMEYVEGAEIKGPLPLAQALRVAVQLADALESAHRSGITHRDLKPANILLAKSGVKVLDFGLARIERPKDSAERDLTATMTLTEQGTIVGTLQYMAPEQLQGKATDVRADIFSFGCVLYEMLTGKRAFDGASQASVIAAILERPAPSVATIAPASLDWTLRLCLAKDPDERWQSARDLRAALEHAAESGADAAAAPVARGRQLVWPAVAGLCAMLAAAVSFTHFREKPSADGITRLSIVAPAKGRFTGVSGGPPAVSPDGKTVIFEAFGPDGKPGLWIRPLDSVTPQMLAGTEGGASPFWSPDSKSIGFFASGKLKKLDVAGGHTTTLADATIGGGSWSSSDVIVFAATYAGALQQIPTAGGTAHPATHVPASPQPQRSPWFLPDGRHFLYLYGSGQGRFAMHVGSLDAAEADRELGEFADSTFVGYSQGYLLYLRGSTLVARPFDAAHAVFTGDALPVAEQVLRFEASGNGVLVYQRGVNIQRLMWTDRAGKSLEVLEGAGDARQVELSPDGKTVAMTVRDAGSGNVDIWLFDTLRGVRTRLTFDPSTDAFPVWTPDGRSVIFRSNRKGQFDLYRRLADGSGTDEPVYADGLAKAPTSISRDGRYLAYWLQDALKGNGLGFLPNPLGAPGKETPYLPERADFSADNPRFSPDGRWVAYQSDETGVYEVYVTSFPGPGGKKQISRAGGVAPRWSRDGKELLYAAGDGYLTAAQVQSKGNMLEVTKVEALFATQLTNASSYDVSPDGRRFLLLTRPDEENSEPLTVVQNWTAGMKRGK